MTWLEKLAVSKRPEKPESWSFLQCLTNLKDLRISDAFDDQASFYLNELVQLEKLDIAGDLSQIAAENVAKLQHLRSLYVRPY